MLADLLTASSQNCISLVSTGTAYLSCALLSGKVSNLFILIREVEDEVWGYLILPAHACPPSGALDAASPTEFSAPDHHDRQHGPRGGRFKAHSPRMRRCILKEFPGEDLILKCGGYLTLFDAVCPGLLLKGAGRALFWLNAIWPAGESSSALSLPSSSVLLLSSDSSSLILAKGAEICNCNPW